MRSYLSAGLRLHLFSLSSASTRHLGSSERTGYKKHTNQLQHDTRSQHPSCKNLSTFLLMTHPRWKCLLLHHRDPLWLWIITEKKIEQWDWVREGEVLLAQWLSLLTKGVRDAEFVDPAASLKFGGSVTRSSHQIFCRDPVYQNSDLAFVAAGEAGLHRAPPRWKSRKYCLAGTARKQSPQSQRVRWQISKLLAILCPGSRSQTQKHLLFLERVEAIFPPSPFFLNGSDRLARSQNHLWLRVHLFRITIPPLDLWLSLRSHFGRNDNEFEDKSWKNTLLWQLRFPWLIDKCNRVGAIKFVFFHRQGTRAAK